MKTINSRLLTAAVSLAAALASHAALAQGKATTLTVLVSNISTDETFHLADGTTSRVPVAPGAYAIVDDGFSPIRDGARASRALQMLAEDGSPEAFVDELKQLKGVKQAGQFLHDEPFNVTVNPGERLVFAAMFAQSNDLFYTTSAAGIALFDAAGKPLDGDVANPVHLLDAGTEVNERPGAGPNQAPRQKHPGDGKRENGVIGPVKDGFSYPPSDQVLSVSITPAGDK